jgi:hypothetical protein
MWGNILPKRACPNMSFVQCQPGPVGTFATARHRSSYAAKSIGSDDKPFCVAVTMLHWTSLPSTTFRC